MLSGTLDELRPNLDKALSPIADAGLREDIVAALATVLPTSPPPATPAALRRIDRDLLSDNYYVVSDTDLAWLTTFVELALALGSGPVLSAVPGLVAVLYRYRMRGAIVSNEEGTVLLAAKELGSPFTALELSKRLSDHPVFALSTERINTVLEELAKRRARDGDVAAFVARDGEKWRSRV